MKELEVYDNSTIIVMADHGDANENYGINNAVHGILLVKTKESEHGFTISSAPVSYFDLHATIFSELGIDRGNTFFDILDSERKRYFYEYTTERSAFVVKEYMIEGDIDQEGSVKATGKILSPIINEEEYEYDTMLTFGVESTAIPFVVSGVSGTDGGNYSWTNDKNCIFDFNLAKQPQSNLLVTINTVAVYNKNGPQEVIAYINDNLCYQTYVSKAGSIQFIVPADLVGDDNNFILRLELPRAISPRELLGGAEDERILSLALGGLCISETEEELEVSYPQLAIGQNIICTTESEDAVSFFRHGFSSPEKSFTWTNGKSASFVGILREVPEDDLKCTIKLMAVYGDYQNVIISSKDRELYSKRVGDEDGEISFVIPKECMTDGVISCLIELPDATSPAEKGAGSDKRVLALAVKEIDFSEVNERKN